MGMKCYYKPKRTKRRRYTENDIARIAGYVVDDGVPWSTIFGVLAITGGFATIFCKAVNFMSALDDIKDYLLDIFELTGLIGAISSAIAVLKFGTGIPLVRRVVILLIAFLGATLIMLRRIEKHRKTLQEASVFKEVTTFFVEVCRAADLKATELIAAGKSSILSKSDQKTFNGGLIDGN